MVKISEKQLAVAEEIICRHVQDPYARHEAVIQLHQQVKLLKKLGSLQANDDGPAINLYIRGSLDIQLSREVCMALGLGE